VEEAAQHADEELAAALKKYMRGVIKPLLEAALADDAKSA
jgi:hypothetical protein